MLPTNDTPERCSSGGSVATTARGTEEGIDVIEIPTVTDEHIAELSAATLRYSESRLKFLSVVSARMLSLSAQNQTHGLNRLLRFLNLR